MTEDGSQEPRLDPVIIEGEAQNAASFHGLVGQSPGMLRVYDRIRLYGPLDREVLITGETGTGKELVAQALHRLSSRRRGKLVSVNCSAISEDLFESELFGHERGAFTGAVKTHIGRFERADGSTLFLDELGTMPLRLQAKLLRALEQQIIERVGGDHEIHVDVRIVAAANVKLERGVRAGLFREDLFHRVAVFRIHLPPLRERLEDIPILTSYFIEALNRRYGRDVKLLTKEALRSLQDYHWPGNVRELRNVLERVYVEARADVIGRNHFAEWEREREDYGAGGWNTHLLDERILSHPMPLPTAYGSPLPLLPGPNHDAVLPPGTRQMQQQDEVQANEIGRHSKLTEEVLREALRRTGGNVTQAARLLGRNKTTVYRRLEKLGLNVDDLRDDG